MSETTNQTVPNRRQRRAAMKHQGLLKMKSKLPFKSGYQFANKLEKRVKRFIRLMLKLQKEP